MSGVLVGGSVAGILGALLATPVIATGREVLFYLYRKLLGAPPFPSPEPRSAEPEAAAGSAQPRSAPGPRHAEP
jgi:hypothetical protein